jgi:hypothetical protein
LAVQREDRQEAERRGAKNIDPKAREFAGDYVAEEHARYEKVHRTVSRAAKR